MALEHPVLNLPAGQWLRGSRAVELGAVVALSVAVVVVGALWGSSSEPVSPGSVGSLEAPSQDARETAMAQSSSEAATPPAADRANAAAPEPESAALTASLATSERGTASATIPAQTGIVPGRPDPSGLALPDALEWYQVQRGESLFTIASARGVSVSDLLLWNWHLEESSTLIRGDWIWIPQWDVSAVAEDPGWLVQEGKSGRGGG